MKQRGRKQSKPEGATSVTKRVDRPAVNRATTYTVELTSPSPYYDKVDALVDSLDFDLLEEMGELSLQFYDNDGELDEVAYLAAARERFGDALDDLMDDFETTPLVAPTMPPAPSPALLYTRVAEAEVIDIGSGNCNKLSTCQAAKITATDVEVIKNSHYPVVKLDAAHELRDFMEEKKYEKVLTSFNVLTQLDDIKQVSEFDGLHIVPDVNYLREAMISEMADGKLVTQGKDGKTFEDHIHPQLDGDPISTGYQTVVFYAKRKLKYSATRHGVVTSPYNNPISDAETLPYQACETPKYDGVCVRLTKVRDKPGLIVRNGRGIYLEGEPPDFDLMLEKWPKTGPAQHWILMRVVQYKRFMPFHGVKALRNFCNSVEISIDGVRVREPGHTSLDSVPSDGYIFRHLDEDFRVKDTLTIETRNIYGLLEQLEDNYGYPVIVGEGVVCDGGLREFRLAPGSCEVVFHHVGERKDKDTETPLKTVAGYVARIRNTRH